MHRIHKFSKEITTVSGEIATGNFTRVGTMLPMKVISLYYIVLYHLLLLRAAGINIIYIYIYIHIMCVRLCVCVCVCKGWLAAEKHTQYTNAKNTHKK